MALIPGTSTPVAINTVNGGEPLGTDASYPEYFNNNDLDNGGIGFDIEYDGFTNVFTVKALGLGAGTHTMKLAIADVGDAQWDSAVFIEAGSFSDLSDEVPESIQDVPEPSVLIGLLAVGFGASLLGKKSIKSDN